MKPACRFRRFRRRLGRCQSPRHALAGDECAFVSTAGNGGGARRTRSIPGPGCIGAQQNLDLLVRRGPRVGGGARSAPFLLIRPDEFGLRQDVPLHCLFELRLAWPAEVGKDGVESGGRREIVEHPVHPGHLRCLGIRRIGVVDDERQAFGATGWFRPGKRRRNVLTFAGVARRDFAALGEAGEVRLKVMDEAPFAPALASRVVTRLTSMAAARRRSMMLRPMDEPAD